MRRGGGGRGWGWGVGGDLNDFRFGTSIGRFSRDGASSTAVKGLNVNSVQHAELCLYVRGSRFTNIFHYYDYCPTYNICLRPSQTVQGNLLAMWMPALPGNPCSSSTCKRTPSRSTTVMGGSVLRATRAVRGMSAARTPVSHN